MRAATISNPCDSSPSMTWTWPCLWPLTLKSWTGGVSSKQLIWQRALCWLRRKSIVLVLTPDCRKETYWFGNWRGGIKRGVSNSSWNHPEVKEPENSFWYIVHKTSLQSPCAKLHISPTIYWLPTDQNDTIGCKSANLRLIKMDHFSESALNGRLCLAVILLMYCVFIITNMVSRPTFCVEISFVGLTSIKCSQSTFPGVLKHLGVLWYEVHF